VDCYSFGKVTKNAFYFPLLLNNKLTQPVTHIYGCPRFQVDSSSRIGNVMYNASDISAGINLDGNDVSAFTFGYDWFLDYSATPCRLDKSFQTCSQGMTGVS